jgi:hypothetical protein
MRHHFPHQGGTLNTNDESDVHLPRRYKKSTHSLYFFCLGGYYISRVRVRAEPAFFGLRGAPLPRVHSALALALFLF